jgi:hypothetical protein
VYNLVSGDGIECRIAKLLEQKQALFSTLFDGTSDEVAFEGQAGFVESVKHLVDPLPAGFVADGGAELDGDASELPLPQLAAAEEVPAAPPSLESLGIGIHRRKNGKLPIELPEALAARADEWLPLLAERLRAKS